MAEKRAMARGFLRGLNPLESLALKISCAIVWPMKFAAAIAVFAGFACLIGWGVVELLKGSPWLLLAAVGVFLGTFIKFGCQSH